MLRDLLAGYGLSPTAALYLADILKLLAIIGLSYLANLLAKSIVLRILTHYITNNKFKWDNFLLERKVFHRILLIVPAMLTYSLAPLVPTFTTLIQRLVSAYLSIVAVFTVSAFLESVNDIYQTYEISKVRPIKGYIQIVKIIGFIIGGIVAIAALMGESPVILLSGIGAATAILSIVFKDSLLGLVAGIQLAANDMVRIGDWIEMPKYGANGTVFEISLNTVKVRNFDQTITTIPSYALISDSFINWRGMHASGGRRIKRSVYIDMTSITFCSPELLEKLKKVHLLKDYLEAKEKEIEEYNRKHNIDRSVKVNGRALTNIGVFRIYIQNYLQNNPNIAKDKVLMVRQLAPTEHGLPLEIYCFANDTVWVNYERIQSDIFDHVLAVAPEFGLRLYQNPSGWDLQNVVAKAVGPDYPEHPSAT